MSELDDLLRQVRATPPPKETRRTEKAREAMIRHALVAGRARHTRRLQLRVVGAVCGGLALAAACLLYVLSSDERLARDETYELSLPSGDRMLALREVHFEVESEAPMHRRVRLTDGAMLFDVAPLAPGSTFEVVTSTETVRVRGTVFVVEASASATSVRVFEGHVEVSTTEGVVPLREGERYHASAATERTAALETAGLEAASRRITRLLDEPSIAPTRDVVAREPSEEPEDTVVALEEETVAPRVAEDGRRRPPSPSPRMDSPVVAPETLEPAMETPAIETPAIETPAIETPLTATPVEPAPESWRDEVHSAMVSGDAEAALRLARAAEVRGEPEALDAEVDALRALSRFDEAAALYERMAADPASDGRAAFQAAEIRFRRLHDTEGARRALELAHPAAGSPLRERCLALRAEIDQARSDGAALEATARAYLREFPAGPRAFWMRARLP